MEQARARPEGDADLVERLRRGDKGAFEELVRAHRRPVYLVARRLLRSHEDADEAAQQAFVKAWRALGGFRGEASLRTWLTRIVINVARSMRSGNPAKPATALDEREELPDPGEGSDDRLQREQMQLRVRHAVAMLPPRQREVVVLKVFSEMTYREVAEAMQLSEGTVKAHLHQAVSNLRRSMSDPGSERSG